ncbi:glycosyltransferase family 4 protein [Cecembia calidifontis]|uniref:Glycosyltransferase involved in cell wall biosynthesis n=1 Tax=Cecembia calidifontis TaxID=1187080 RepID=A0A4Q7P977_9BACT|nr:glycosyltransferase family 4 protein [Cecembia calidifontis]RZS96701.1 glycosyltransferase involved in cell wall biosynthesis [Cecembia calidifontis]
MSKKKTVWIINQDATTPETGYAGRSYYLSEELSNLGHKVYLIAGGYSHLHFISPDIQNEVEIKPFSKFDFVWIKLPKYGNAHSKKRILNWFLFAFKISKLLNHIPNKPDVIIYSSPPLIGFLGALKLKRKSKANLIFEIRDIWPLTLKEIGGYGNFNPFIVFMSWIEKLAYRKSDKIISNLSNAFHYLRKFGLKEEKFLWIPNGISISEINKSIPLNPHINELIPKNKFIVGYSGTLGAANALEFFIQASIQLKGSPDIFFVIVGSGKEKQNLISMVDGNQNIIFVDPIPKEQIHSLLSRFDVCYLGWRKHELYEFGIGSNKLPEYLSSGKPIIHSYSGKKDIVSIAEAGITIEAENSQEIISAILKLLRMAKSERDVMGKNGLNFAHQYLRYDSLAKTIENELF